MSAGLVILDRDGVINFDSDEYIKSPEEWIPIPGSLEAVARLCRADYRVTVATNQSGIARGLYNMATLNRIHLKMVSSLHERGGQFEAVFFCPHGPDDGCNCRKPRPGMLHQTSERLSVPLAGVPVVGDSRRDLESATAVGALPVLVKTGNGEATQQLLLDEGLNNHLRGIPVYTDLAAFADDLLSGGLDQQMRPPAGG
jgi:D-glycero-D-manno-heptose 1,7-bisphosphate phosphatase